MKNIINCSHPKMTGQNDQLFSALGKEESGRWIVSTGGCKVDTNIWGGDVLLSSSFMRVPLVCFDSSFFIVISTCVMLV